MKGIIFNFNFLIMFFLICGSTNLVLANNSCSSYLETSSIQISNEELKSNIKRIIETLGLMTPSLREVGPDSKKFELQIDNFVSSQIGILKLSGGPELIEIFVHFSNASQDELTMQLTEWSSKFIPNYKLLFSEDAENFKFENGYANQNISKFDRSKDQFDDKFLMELLRKRRIPILSSSDLLSQLIIFALPEKRKFIERIALAFYEGQNLGDTTVTDRHLGVENKNFYFRDDNRLAYIAKVYDILVGQFQFLSPHPAGRQLVAMGATNLGFLSTAMKSLDASKIFDISLSARSPELNYFSQQSRDQNPKVNTFYQLLSENGLAPHLPDQYIDRPEEAHSILKAAIVDHFGYIAAVARMDIYSGSSEDIWLRLSDQLYRNSNSPAYLLARSRFRSLLVSIYLDIVEYNISWDKEMSRREVSGFR